MLKNVNLEKLKELYSKHKKGVRITAFTLASALVVTVASCAACNNGDEKATNDTTIETESNELNNNESIENETVVNNSNENNESSNNETVVEDETKEEVEEVVITELNVEEFNKLVDKVEKANAEAGLNLRRENLELVVYINNINLATPELIEKIESAYNYNEEDMINVYLQTMTSYNNDKLEYYNGEDAKYADESLMFADKIDRETIEYIDSLFEGLYVNVSDESKIELTMEKFNIMVEDIMAKNEELGINLSREEVEIAIYQRNSKYVTDDVKTYVESIKLAEGQTLETVDNNTLNIYKAFNKESKTDFNLSNLEFESYYVGMVVEELEGYMRENNTINGYTKDQLTVGGLFTAKLKIDDAFAYFATTGYANGYEENITAIAEANLDACVARTYAILGSKAALVNCEEVKTLTHTNE